ncbi:MAG TPA: hypothetical protein P5158_00180, partial [Chitinophagaceae bacterium]|nr:hypothetical protein [Chitinophagaceae bacterium]
GGLGGFGFTFVASHLIIDFYHTKAKKSLSHFFQKIFKFFKIRFFAIFLYIIAVPKIDLK